MWSNAVVVIFDSDIAVRVVDQISRARSAESSESPPEVGMFAEPVNVLSWIGSSLDPVTNSLPLTAEDLDQIDPDKDFAREDAHLNGTIQRMRGFLSDNATFEWLKQRIQSVMSTGGGGHLTSVSGKILGILKQGHSAASNQNVTYTLDWDPCEFMRCNYTSYIDVASVISINSDGHAYEACTVGEFITRFWPVTGPQFLEAMRSWWMHISNGREEELVRRMSACHLHCILD
jgi:hypothetical protein